MRLGDIQRKLHVGTAVAMRIQSKARLAYEADVEKRPTYPNGDRRKSWDELSSVAQWSWGRTHGVDERAGGGASA